MQIDNEKLTSLDRKNLEYLISFCDADKLPDRLNAFYKQPNYRKKYKISSKQPLQKDANTFRQVKNIVILLEYIFAQKLDNAEIIDIFDDAIKSAIGLDPKDEMDADVLEAKCKSIYEDDMTKSKASRMSINAVYCIYGLEPPDFAKISDEEEIPDAQTAADELEKLNSDKKEKNGKEKEKVKKAAPAKKAPVSKKIAVPQTDIVSKKDTAKKKNSADIDKKDQTIETLKKNYNKLVNSVKNVDPSEVNDYEVEQIVDLEALSDSVKQETEHFARCIENGDYENAKKTLAYLYVLVSATEDSKHE